MYQDFKKSGIIHKIIQSKLKNNFNSFNTSLDIVEFIENEINNDQHNAITTTQSHRHQPPH